MDLSLKLMATNKLTADLAVDAIRSCGVIPQKMGQLVQVSYSGNKNTIHDIIGSLYNYGDMEITVKHTLPDKR